MASFTYKLTYAGIPFVTDVARTIPLASEMRGGTNPKDQPPAKHQVELDLVDELNRLLPWQYLADFAPPSQYPGRNLAAVARAYDVGPYPNATVRIGDYYYPTGAARWGVFRGLATSSMVKEMVALSFANATTTAKEFVMQAVPQLVNGANEIEYTVTTDLYMLPPRPLAEHGANFDGLFLVTLVDERWYWQYKSVSLSPREGPVGRTSWNNLISTVATALGISLSATIADDYLYPEPDSQLFCREQNAAVVLDAIAANLGLTLVRKLDGTFSLLTNTASQTLVNSNRGTATDCIRTAGGDLFSTVTQLPAGILTSAKNAILPANIKVCFPAYIEPRYSGPGAGDSNDPSASGKAPIPYLVNARYANKRPSTQYEDGFGSVWTKTIAISAAGSNYTGLGGLGTHTIHSTAKALFDCEADLSGNPRNNTELSALALQLAKNYWDGLSLSALDEVYPGTYAWSPEGYNDIIWTYSSRSRLASTRVFRSEWNQIVREYQHSTTRVPRGVGGPSIPLTIRDSFSGDISHTVTNLYSGSYTAIFDSVTSLPTQNRWKGLVNSTERVLFEGTSGGTTVDVVQRGIDGTEMGNWVSVTCTQITGNTTYGINLETTEKMQFVYPAEWTSGGLQGIRRVPQTQTVMALSDEYTTIQGLRHHSGYVESFDSVNNTYPNQELIWIIERNEAGVTSGRRYDGQIAGYAAGTPPIRPVYLVNEGETATGTVYVTLGTNQTDYTLPNARRLVITTSGRFRFFSFAPSVNRKIEIINQGPDKIIYEGESPFGTAAGRIAIPFNPTPTLYLSGGAPETDPSSRYQADCMQHPNQTLVLEYVGAGTSGGKYKIENPPAKHTVRTVYFTDSVAVGQPVYIRSGVGYSGLPQVTIAQANFDVSGVQQRHPTMGLATNTFTSGEIGEITTEGPLYNVDTRNFTVGDRVYLNVSGSAFFTATPLGMASGTNGMGSGIQQPIGHVTTVGQSGSIHVHLEPVKTVVSGDLWAKVIFSGNVASGAIIGCLFSGAPEASGIFSGNPLFSGVRDCLPYNIASGTLCGCLLASGTVHSGHLYVAGEPRAFTFLRATDEAFPGIQNFAWSQVHAANVYSGRVSGTSVVGFQVNTREFEQTAAGVLFWGSVKNQSATFSASGSPMIVQLSWSDYWGNMSYYQALLGPMIIASGETFSGSPHDAINLSGFLGFDSKIPTYQESHSGPVYQPILSGSITVRNASGPDFESDYGINVTRIG